MLLLRRLESVAEMEITHLIQNGEERRLNLTFDLRLAASRKCSNCDKNMTRKYTASGGRLFIICPDAMIYLGAWCEWRHIIKRNEQRWRQKCIQIRIPSHSNKNVRTILNNWELKLTNYSVLSKTLSPPLSCERIPTRMCMCWNAREPVSILIYSTIL